jgi:hypothetical protein
MNNRKALLAYFGHHKCASTWINTINYAVCRELNLTFEIIDSPEFQPWIFQDGLNAFVEKNRIDFLAYINADIEFIKDMDFFSGFHVIRDPRDIVVSAYFSHLYSHPTDGWPDLVGYRAKLQKLSKEEGLLLEMEFRKKEFESLYNWDYSQNNVLELTMEDIISSPYETMARAFSCLELVNEKPTLKHRIMHCIAMVINAINAESKGLVPFRAMIRKKIPVDIVLGYIFQNRFSKITQGRNYGEEDVRSHYRKGVSGDWVNHFSPEHCRIFKEKYNDVLIKLGYEKSANW